MKTKELLVLKSQATSTNMASSTKISVAPNDPTDVVKNIAPLLLRRKLDVDICGFGFNKEAVQ